jgi:hypothetical protein
VLAVRWGVVGDCQGCRSAVINWRDGEALVDLIVEQAPVDGIG